MAKAKTENTKKAEEAIVEETPVETADLDGVATLEPVNEDEAKETAFDAFVQHQRRAIQSTGKAFESLIPNGVREHGQKAVEEALEGYRVLFNSALDDVLKMVRSTQDEVDKFAGRVEDRVEHAKLEKRDGDESETV